MHLAKLSKTSFFITCLLFSNVFAKELDENILSNSRKKVFDLNEEQAKEDSNKLKKDWINPITYKFTKNLGQDYKNEKSLISINQPIFQSGGIYQAILYAKSSYNYANLEIKEQRKLLIKDAVNYLFMIEKTSLNLKKAKLTLKNAKIDVNRKKEQVLNGFLDSSFLDNALLDLNKAKHSIVDLEYEKKQLINSFENIASKKYTDFNLPEFKIFSQKEFIENNLALKKAKANIQRKENFSYMTKAKYLPSINAFYNYSKNHYTDNKPNLQKDSEQNFGLSINMPFDSRTFNDIQSKKIDYLKAKLALKNKTSDEETFFKTKLEKIDTLDKRINITKEDLELYKSILNIIKEEKDAQLKTQSDFDTLNNSKNIKYLDLEIFKIEKQMQLLELYTKLL